MMLVILGPDGSGKSTVISALQAPLRDRFQVLEYFHLKPRLIPGSRHQESGPVTDPHGQRLYPAWLSCIKLIYFLLLYNIGYLIQAPLLLHSKQLAIFDRYYYDILVDPKRFRYGGSKLLAGIISTFIPKPHLLILLDAPAEVLYSRKQEVPYDEVKRQREAYVALCQAMPNAHIVDASQSVEHIVSEIIEKIHLTHHSVFKKSASYHVAV